MTDTFTFVGGEQQRETLRHISARDRGLTLADGVFETMRIRHRRVFQLPQHLARLRHGLDVLQIAPAHDLERLIADAVDTSGADDASLRVTVTRGVGPAGLLPPAASEPTVIVTVAAMPSFPASTYQDGLRAHVPSGRRNARAATAGLKTLSYTDAIVGLLEARQHGADEALFLDTDDHCSEASASNLFLWTGAALVTPPPSCGALPGVTRATVLELAVALGLKTEERPCTLDELLSAQESFLTSSLRGIAPLAAVNGRTIGAGRPGAMTQRLSAAHDALIERECVR